MTFDGVWTPPAELNEASILKLEHSSNGAEIADPVVITLTITSDEEPQVPPPSRNSGLSLCVGGPVETQGGWILLGEEGGDLGARRVVDGVYLSTSPDLLRHLIETGAGRTRDLTGYAGWGPGQLDDELAASAWLTSDVEPDLIFDTPPYRMWEEAIRRLGADPALMQVGHGVH